MLATNAPYRQYFDLDGSPLTGGKLYFGLAGEDPLESPAAIFWDSAGLVPAAQPVPTLNGYLVRSGAPANVYTAADYSVLVLNRLGQTVFYADSSANFANDSVLDARISALQSDLASTNSSAKAAGQVGYSVALAYADDTVGAKLREVRSVMDYGASPTATAAENVIAIQAAIDAISSVGTVFVPAGSYPMDAGVTVPAGKSISFRGAGRGISILAAEIAVADPLQSVLKFNGSSGSECPDITISDLTVNARRFGKGIEALYCYPKLVIDNVDVWKPGQTGIYAEECWGATLKDCHVDGDNASDGNGIHVVNANAVVLLNPRVYNMKNTAQSRGIYATSAENFLICGGNVENCPRGIHIELNGTYHGPATIDSVYFEPRAMSAWDAGQPNDNILIEGASAGAGTAIVRGCLLQPGTSGGSAVAVNGVTARNLACLTMQGNVWQKANFAPGGAEHENFFVDADSTVTKVIQTGNYLVSTSIGNLNTISTSLLNVSNVNDSGTNNDVIGALQELTIKSSTGVPLAAMYRDAIVGGSAGVGNIDIGAREDATTFVTGARVSAISDGAWTTSNHGTDVLFYTTPNGSTTLTQRMQLEAGGTVQPGADNSQNLGSGSLRWQTVFAGTGAINTSDARAKEQVRTLDDAERAVAVRIKGLLRAFKFRDAVAAKGDGARLHFGVIAQEVAAAFEAEGLDPHAYALFCHDEWGEKPAAYDADGNLLREAVPAGDAYGIRYEELLCFVLGAM